MKAYTPPPIHPNPGIKRSTNMRFRSVLWLLPVLFFAQTLCAGPPDTADWGFFAHRRINRLAVLTLPPEMMTFYKTHIDWISDHAVDPDMRRYASPFEGPRHFIDLDMYGAPPFDTLPRERYLALIKFIKTYGVTAAKDTICLFGPGGIFEAQTLKDAPLEKAWRSFFVRQVMPLIYSGEVALNRDSLQAFLKNNQLERQGRPLRIETAFFKDDFSTHGILPWHLQKMQRDLTEAFRRRDSRRILRLSAEIGHYIGDGHVPLHTTSNYNGQQTGQHGIHGFWESRIPELFADEGYDYFVGKPEYLRNTTEYFWQMTLASHSMVDSVLTFERALRLKFPADRQLCPDMRNGISIIAPCRDYAAAYQEALDGMIERRMRATIHAVSNSWYTAWVDAGQPNLKNLELPVADAEAQKEEAEMKKSFEGGKILGRPEEH